MSKAITVTAVSLVALGILGYFLTIGLGKPIGTDLSVIAQGRPALVLAYENFSPNGGPALNRLRAVRSDYDSRLDFIVADIGTPQGSEFAERYQLVDGLAVFLNEVGKLQKITSIPVDEQALRRLLDAELARN